MSSWHSAQGQLYLFFYLRVYFRQLRQLPLLCGFKQEGQGTVHPGTYGIGLLSLSSNLKNANLDLLE
jgi:hypothetical protein